MSYSHISFIHKFCTSYLQPASQIHLQLSIPCKYHPHPSHYHRLFITMFPNNWPISSSPTSFQSAAPYYPHNSDSIDFLPIPQISLALCPPKILLYFLLPGILILTPTYPMPYSTLSFQTHSLRILPSLYLITSCNLLLLYKTFKIFYNYLIYLCT